MSTIKGTYLSGLENILLLRRAREKEKTVSRVISSLGGEKFIINFMDGKTRQKEERKEITWQAGKGGN